MPEQNHRCFCTNLVNISWSAILHHCCLIFWCPFGMRRRFSWSYGISYCPLATFSIEKETSKNAEWQDFPWVVFVIENIPTRRKNMVYNVRTISIVAFHRKFLMVWVTITMCRCDLKIMMRYHCPAKHTDKQLKKGIRNWANATNVKAKVFLGLSTANLHST